MNIPNLFMEPHEIITSHLWPSEKYFIWIKIIQRTHQPWILLRTIMNNYSGQLSLGLGELVAKYVNIIIHIEGRNWDFVCL